MARCEAHERKRGVEAPEAVIKQNGLWLCSECVTSSKHQAELNRGDDKERAADARTGEEIRRQQIRDDYDELVGEPRETPERVVHNLAQSYGKPRSEIREIVGLAKAKKSGRKAKVSPPNQGAEDGTMPKIRDDLDAAKIKAEHKSGMSVQAIAEKHKASWPTIRNILDGKGAGKKKRGKKARGKKAKRARRKASDNGAGGLTLVVAATQENVNAIFDELTLEQEVALINLGRKHGVIE